MYYRMIIALSLIVFICERIYYTAIQQEVPTWSFWKGIGVVVFVVISVVYLLEVKFGLI